jgi:hypothetical protein
MHMQAHLSQNNINVDSWTLLTHTYILLSTNKETDN